MADCRVARPPSRALWHGVDAQYRWPSDLLSLFAPLSMPCRWRSSVSTGCRFGKLNPGVSVVQPALDHRIRVIEIEELIKRANVDQSMRDAVSSGSPRRGRDALPPNHLRAGSHKTRGGSIPFASLRFLELLARPSIFDLFTGIGKPEPLRYGPSGYLSRGIAG